jgi:hypothetical protein
MAQISRANLNSPAAIRESPYESDSGAFGIIWADERRYGAVPVPAAPVQLVRLPRSLTSLTSLLATSKPARLR